VLCVGEFGVSLGEVSVFCMWESLVWVWGSECVLCVGQFGVGLGERVCGVCGRVWWGFGKVSRCCGWESFVWVGGVSVCYVLERWVWDWGRECVVFVGEFGVGLGE